MSRCIPVRAGSEPMRGGDPPGAIAGPQKRDLRPVCLATESVQSLESGAARMGTGDGPDPHSYRVTTTGQVEATGRRHPERGTDGSL